MDIMAREEIEERYKWDLSSIFENDEAFLDALEKAKRYPEQCAAFEGEISKSADKLWEFLCINDQLAIDIMKLVNYANRKSDEDTRVSLYQDYSNQVMSVYIAIASSTAWFTSELLTLSEETMAEFYQKKPELELYRRKLDQVFSKREHTLSPAEEALLANAEDMASQPGNIFSLLNDADLVFGEAQDFEGTSHPVTHGSFIPLMTSPDRALRKSAYEQLYASYRQFRNTFATTLGAQTKQLKFFSDARHYESPLHQALDENEVPVQVYTNLIEAIHRNLPALHKYINLRKEALGVDTLHFYDLYTPIVGDVEMKFTYEQACDIMLKALEPMGEEYLALVRKGIEERWIDVYENPGKRSGAYSAGGYDMQPVILLNFHGTLDDVYTLVHEMGHSIHTYLSCKNQPSVYSDYVIFVAEVASTCNEALLTHYLLNNAESTPQRAYILNHFLEQFRATIYRQTMFAEFELAINEITATGAGLTADTLCEVYTNLNATFFGEGVELDENIALEWARIPHFYYRYYVYQYATGFAAAIALSQQILNEGKPARDRYLTFLSGGSSKPPIELLRDAGVDMTTTKPIDDALTQFDALLDEMKELLK